MISEFERGNNAIDAIVDYVKKIKGKKIRINSNELHVPSSLNAVGKYETLAPYKFEISKDLPEE